VVGRGAGTFP